MPRPSKPPLERGERRHPRRNWFLVIVTAALVIRSIYLFEILPAPFFPFKMGDAASYDRWAHDIADGDWLGDEIFYQAPLYPYFLAVVYRLVDDESLTIRVCQLLLSSVACGLLMLAGWRAIGKRAGIVAGLGLAVYGPSLFFDSTIQKCVLDNFLICLLLVAWSRLLDRHERSRWVCLGAAVGALTLARENALILVPATLVWIVIARSETMRPSWKTAGWFLLGTSMVLLPVAARNYHVGGEFHLTTSQFGPNFYIGNNAEANGSYRPLRPYRGSARYERLDAQQLAESDLGHALTPAEVSHYWTARATTFIARQPVAWMRLMGRKCLLACNSAEIVDTEDPYTYAEWSTCLAWSQRVWHFGVLLPLAVLGVYCSWDRRNRFSWIYLVILFYLAGVVLFYVVGRYRYPAVPPLLLLAAMGLTEFPQWMRHQSRSSIVFALASAAAVAVIGNWPIVSPDRMRATTHYNVGVELEAEQFVEAAVQEYKLAATLDPRHPGIHNNLGVAYRTLGKLGKSEEHLRRAFALHSEFTEANYNLGVTLLVAEKYADARGCFEQLAKNRPNMARAHLGLAVAEEHLGHGEKALRAYRYALQLDPDLTEARTAIGKLTTKLEESETEQ